MRAACAFSASDGPPEMQRGKRMARTVKRLKGELLDSPEVLDGIFCLIYENMKELCPPTGEDREEDKRIWLEFNRQGVLQNGRTTALVYDGQTLCGFLQYERADRLCCWGDMDIAPRYRKDGVTIRLLVREFLRDGDFADCETICTQIMDKNRESWSLAVHLGFREGEKTARGHRYFCERSALKKFEK